MAGHGWRNTESLGEKQKTLGQEIHFYLFKDRRWGRSIVWMIIAAVLALANSGKYTSN